MKSKVSIIVEARMGSTRLPKKILNKIKKYSFLEYLIKKLRMCENADEIIIATTNDEDNKEIIDIAKKNKVRWYKGSHHNLLSRVINAGKKFNCKTLVRVTSDCPLIDISIIDQMIDCYKNNNCDYLSNANIRTYPDGMDVEIFDLKSLIKSEKFAKTKKHLEWTTWSIKRNPKIFKCINIISPKELYWPGLGLTLDEYDDYILLKKILVYFKERMNVSCFEIINFFKKKKNWLKINKNVKRKLKLKLKK